MRTLRLARGVRPEVVLLGADGADLPGDMAALTQLPSADRIRSVVGADTASVVTQSRADVDAASNGLTAEAVEPGAGPSATSAFADSAVLPPGVRVSSFNTQVRSASVAHHANTTMVLRRG